MEQQEDREDRIQWKEFASETGSDAMRWEGGVRLWTAEQNRSPCQRRRAHASREIKVGNERNSEADKVGRGKGDGLRWL